MSWGPLQTCFSKLVRLETPGPISSKIAARNCSIYSPWIFHRPPKMHRMGNVSICAGLPWDCPQSAKTTLTLGSADAALLSTNPFCRASLCCAKMWLLFSGASFWRWCLIFLVFWEAWLPLSPSTTTGPRIRTNSSPNTMHLKDNLATKPTYIMIGIAWNNGVAWMLPADGTFIGNLIQAWTGNLVLLECPEYTHETTWHGDGTNRNAFVACVVETTNSTMGIHMGSQEKCHAFRNDGVGNAAVVLPASRVESKLHMMVTSPCTHAMHNCLIWMRGDLNKTCVLWMTCQGQNKPRADPAMLSLYKQCTV